MDRKETARCEVTSNPIFLFQSRWWHVTGVPSPFYMTEEGDLHRVIVRDGEGARLLDEAEWQSVSIEVLKDYQNDQGYSCLIEEWKTERVFFTREEGEAYARSQAHNCPHGSRVYCVCAHGELAKILREADAVISKNAELAALKKAGLIVDGYVEGVDYSDQLNPRLRVRVQPVKAAERIELTAILLKSGGCMTTTPPKGHDSWLEKGCDWLDTIEERKAARAELAALRARLLAAEKELQGYLSSECTSCTFLAKRLEAAEARVGELEARIEAMTPPGLAEYLTVDMKGKVPMTDQRTEGELNRQLKDPVYAAKVEAAGKVLAAEDRIEELEQLVHMQMSGNMAQRLTAAREALAYERLAYERRVTAARDDLSNFNGRMDDMVKAAARKREGG